MRTFTLVALLMAVAAIQLSCIKAEVVVEQPDERGLEAGLVALDDGNADDEDDRTAKDPRQRNVGHGNKQKLNARQNPQGPKSAATNSKRKMSAQNKPVRKMSAQNKPVRKNLAQTKPVNKSPFQNKQRKLTANPNKRKSKSNGGPASAKKRGPKKQLVDGPKRSALKKHNRNQRKRGPLDGLCSILGPVLNILNAIPVVGPMVISTLKGLIDCSPDTGKSTTAKANTTAAQTTVPSVRPITTQRFTGKPETTKAPTPPPTTVPTSGPTAGPTGGSTAGPTESQTGGPTASPTEGQTGGSTTGPTGGSTAVPTEGQTAGTTDDPTENPTTNSTGA